MKRKLLSLLAVFLILASMIPFPAMAENEPVITYMYVKTDNGAPLNMREADSADSRVLTKIPYGTQLQLMDYFIGAPWASCSYNGYYGYVMTRYLSCDKPGPSPTARPRPVPTPRPEPRPTPVPRPNPVPVENMFSNFLPVFYNAVVRPSTPASFVHMRWAPSKSQPIIYDYNDGQALQVLYANDTWCQVFDPTTHVCGFMMREFLTFVSPIDYGDGLGNNAGVS